PMNPEPIDLHPITLGVKRQHCFEDILNDVPESKSDLKRIRTEDNYPGGNAVISAAISNNYDGALNTSLNNVAVKNEKDFSEFFIKEGIENDLAGANYFDKKENNLLGDKNSGESANISEAICHVTNPEFDSRKAQDNNCDPSFIYSFPTSNVMSTGKTMDSISYEQQPSYNIPDEPSTINSNLKPPRENEISLPEGYRIDKRADSNLGLLMQAIVLLERGVSSLPDD
ncbi:2113_t:CDS:1, partial [Acaulospora colombiana]